MTPTLWQIEASLYSEKARWALAWKRVSHGRRAPLPGTHRPIALWLTRGKHDRLPVLALPDGRTIGDSTAIVAALEDLHPDPPLYPADPAQRARALELEEFFDEECGPHTRRFVWFHAIDDPDVVLEMLLPRASAARRRTLRTAAPFAARAVRWDYGVDEEGATASLAALRGAMDRLEAELDGGDHLVGDAFSVADLTAASLLTPVICPPEREYPPAAAPPAVLELRAELEARPGGQWVHATYARYRNR